VAQNAAYLEAWVSLPLLCFQGMKEQVGTSDSSPDRCTVFLVASLNFLLQLKNYMKKIDICVAFC
jgi:hypothetical protein